MGMLFLAAGDINKAIDGTYGSANDNLAGGATASCSAPVQTARIIQKAGPSVALFSDPYYSCVQNFYVATNGSNG